MAQLPTPEETAREILDIFVNKFQRRPGHVLQINHLESLFINRGLQVADLPQGIAYANDRGWLEVGEDGRTFTLTQDGFAEA